MFRNKTHTDRQIIIYGGEVSYPTNKNKKSPKEVMDPQLQHLYKLHVSYPLATYLVTKATGQFHMIYLVICQFLFTFKNFAANMTEENWLQDGALWFFDLNCCGRLGKLVT